MNTDIAKITAEERRPPRARAAAGGAQRIHDFVAIGVIFSLSLSSLGTNSPIALSVSSVICFSLSLVLLGSTRVIRVDQVTVALLFFIALLTISLVATLDIGSDVLSYLRGAFWFFNFLVLYNSFTRCNLERVVRAALKLALLLAIFHIIQVLQVRLGGEALRLVPDAWHFMGDGVRWHEDHDLARPAVIFTEPGWYAYFQSFVLALTLVWAGVKLSSRMVGAVAVIAFSILLSGSILGVILLLAILAIHLVTRHKISMITLALYVLPIAVALVGYILFTGPGQAMVARLTGGSDTSTLIRVVYPWIRVAEVLAERPWLGVGIGNEAAAGFGSIEYFLPAFNNIFAYFLATSGLIGFLGLIIMLVAVGWRHPLQLVLYALFCFAQGNGLGELFWIPLMVWAGMIRNQDKVV